MKSLPKQWTQLQEMAVTIVGVNTTSGMIMCRDAYANQFEIDGNVRRKGTGMPQPGERWFLLRKGNHWVADIQIGAPGIRTITGSRDGLHPVMSQMLDAMSEAGLILDQTVAPIYPLLTDANDPTDDTDTNADITPDDSTDSDSDPDAIPASASGPAPETTTDKPRKGWIPLYLGSFNTSRALGPQRCWLDLNKLTSRTRIQIFGAQEMSPPSRDGISDRIAGKGWSYYRPDASTIHNRNENTIFWRTDDFDLLDQDSIELTPAGPAGGGRPPRFLNWVKLTHLDSRRVIYFMDTHYHGHIEGHTAGYANEGPSYRPGHPSTDPAEAGHVSDAFTQIQTTADTIRQFSAHAPVFLAGDFNVNWFPDAKVRDHRFPYSQFKKTGTRSNWDLIDHHPGYGTHGDRYIDQIWVTHPQTHQIRYVDQWILTGYYSDHRPVMVKSLIRAKN